DVVDCRYDEHAPQQDKNAPPRFTTVDEPQTRGNPDERRPDGDRRQQKRDESQQWRRFDSRDPESETGKNALNEGSAENPQNHATHSPNRDAREMPAVVAGDARD